MGRSWKRFWDEKICKAEISTKLLGIVDSSQTEEMGNKIGRSWEEMDSSMFYVIC